MLRRHREGLIRDGENADMALDRMIEEEQRTQSSRARSVPPTMDAAVRRLVPVAEQEGMTQGDLRGGAHGRELQGP